MSTLATPHTLKYFIALPKETIEVSFQTFNEIAIKGWESIEIINLDSSGKQTALNSPTKNIKQKILIFK